MEKDNECIRVTDFEDKNLVYSFWEIYHDTDIDGLLICTCF